MRREYAPGRAGAAGGRFFAAVGMAGLGWGGRGQCRGLSLTV